jgi:hypothetical protein
MTDRLRGVIVTFEKDIREDDAQPLLVAIEQLRGVLSVKPIVATIDSHISEERAKHELGQNVLKVIYPEKS